MTAFALTAACLTGTATAGADIYWTIDGTEPAPDNGAKYLAQFPLGTNGTLAINPLVYPNHSYDPVKGWTALSYCANVPNVLAVNAAKYGALVEALVRQLQGTARVNQAAVDNARLMLSYTKVTAPISGRLGLKQADLGNVIRSSDANGLVTITQTQPISAVFALPEANLQQLARKLRGTDALGVEAWDRELRNVLASGKVTTIDNSIDPVTGTIKVKAEFANADGSLFPNQFVNIKLQINTLEAALAVPSTAVQRGAQGTFVYVVKPDSNVTVRRIRVGTTEGDWVSVQGELAAGDKVVTDGADRLREGAKVEVITPSRGFGGFGPGGPGGGFGGPRRDGANSGAGAAGAPGGAASGPRGASAPAASTEQKAAGPSDAVTGKPPQAAPASQGGRPAPASGGAVSSSPSARTS